MTIVQELARFVVDRRFEDLSDAARRGLKVCILDSLACAIGALEGEPIRYLREQREDFGSSEQCTAIGGARSAPDRAALYNSALIRYLDYNDSYLARGETCHPSDNFGAVLAACEYAGRSGRDLLTSLAVAYQVQCRLSDEAPVRAKGFDHTTQGSYAAAAGVAKALGLDEERAANAIAIAGTALNALRVTRTGRLSHWKGLAYPHTSFGATHAAFLAMRGITGPLEVFEGNKGFMDAVAGQFEIDWAREDLERVTRTIIKKYNAEIHSQSATEGLLDLQADHGFAAGDVESIDVEIFDVAFNIIGGGEEGAKTDVRTKEEADHSLNYILAVALLDGQVMPEQYLPERIARDDVQSLLRCITIRPRDDYSRRFPDEMPCGLTVRLRDARTLEKEKSDYEGFFTRPASWTTVTQKLEKLSAPYADANLRREIVDVVTVIDEIEVSDLTAILAKVPDPSRR